MRPIDADALKESFEEDGHLSGYIEEYIDNCPTVEVTARNDVIRCPDCVYYGKSPFGHPTLGWCRIDGKHRGRSFYCANADRKEEGNA